MKIPIQATYKPDGTADYTYAEIPVGKIAEKWGLVQVSGKEVTGETNDQNLH